MPPHHVLSETAGYQTVRLGRGRHPAPGPEVCVMELASMLAGESFSDHPTCACPVISTLLRSYNDRLDDERRQQLLPLAALVVGTRASHATTQLRYRALVQWCRGRNDALPRWRRPLRRARLEVAPRTLVDLSLLALRSLPRRVNDRSHAEFVALIEQLVATEDPASTPQRPSMQAHALLPA